MCYFHSILFVTSTSQIIYLILLSLSTVSSGLNSLAAVTQADIINKILSRQLPDEKATIVSKIIAASYGAICIALTFVVGSLGGVLQVSARRSYTCTMCTPFT